MYADVCINLFGIRHVKIEATQLFIVLMRKYKAIVCVCFLSLTPIL